MFCRQANIFSSLTPSSLGCASSPPPLCRLEKAQGDNARAWDTAKWATAEMKGKKARGKRTLKTSLLAHVAPQGIRPRAAAKKRREKPVTRKRAWVVRTGGGGRCLVVGWRFWPLGETPDGRQGTHWALGPWTARMEPTDGSQSSLGHCEEPTTTLHCPAKVEEEGGETGQR